VSRSAPLTLQTRTQPEPQYLPVGVPLGLGGGPVPVGRGDLVLWSLRMCLRTVVGGWVDAGHRSNWMRMLSD